MQILTTAGVAVGIYIQGYITRPCYQSGDVRIIEHLFGANTDGPFMFVGVSMPVEDCMHIADVFCSSYMAAVDEFGKAESKCSALLLFTQRPSLEQFSTYGAHVEIDRQTLATYDAFLLSHKDHAHVSASEFNCLIPIARQTSPYKMILSYMLTLASSNDRVKDKKTISRLIISICQQAVHDGEMEMSEVCDAIMKL